MGVTRRNKKAPTKQETIEIVSECRTRLDINKKKQKNYNKNVEDWLTFSTHPQSEEDIRKRLIREIKENSPCKYVCLSYVCKYSKLSEDFIEELIYLTGMTRYNRNRDYTAEVKNGFYKYYTERIRSSRVDWYNICLYQKLSEAFIERHKNDVLWSVIIHTQDLSEDFKQEHKHYYETSLGLEDSLKESGDMS